MAFESAFGVLEEAGVLEDTGDRRPDMGSTEPEAASPSDDVEAIQLSRSALSCISTMNSWRGCSEEGGRGSSQYQPRCDQKH